jgi:protocatechuate 3,4-dioxygenase, beta subunit
MRPRDRIFRAAKEKQMSAPLFSKREVLVAGGVGLLAATGYTLLPQPSRPIAASGAGPAIPLEPLEDGREVERPRASALRAGQNDLTRMAPGATPADGVPILISGRLANGFGRPLPATRIEIWNANRWGRYTHIYDPSHLLDDPNFAGIGRTLTDDQGRFHFLTVEPGAYPAEIGGARLRPAHVHVAIRSGTARLVTQLYLPGDPALADDPMFALLGDAGRRHIAREFQPAIAAAARGFRFDIVTDGPQATFFE